MQLDTIQAISARMAALEIVLKVVAATVLKTSGDPNLPGFIERSFQSSVDVLSINAPSPEIAKLVREAVRNEGLAIVQSILTARDTP